jgi:stalled ribosome rescue protein Dom34
LARHLQTTLEKDIAMPHYHAAVWLDHHTARVFDIGADEIETFTVHAHPKHRQVHHKHGALGSGHVEGDRAFFEGIADHLKTAGEILVAGPGKAKLEFQRFLHKHAPQIEAKIAALETVDHPSDGQFVAYARRAFLKIDQMRG